MNDQQSKRAAIYARVSTLAQEDGYGLQTQEEGYRRYAPVHGYVVDESHIYHDIESGRALYERPQVLALRDAIHRRAIDAVIIYDLDRLMRDPDLLAMLFAEAKHAEVEIEFVTAQFDKSPEGTLLRNILAYVAQKEHEKIRERMMRGHQARVEPGKLLPGGTGKALYGYQWNADRTAYLPDEEEAAILRRVFEQAAAGASIRSIARKLTEASIPTPSGGPTWGWSSFHAMLKHPFYSGHPMAYRWHTRAHKTPDRRTGAWRTVYTNQERPPDQRIPLPPGAVPSLVPEELAAAVLDRLALNKTQSKRNNHPEDTLLRNGFATCGYCGKHLATTHARGTGYNCLQNGPGKSLFITAALLDAATWLAVREVILEPTIIAKEVEKRRTAPQRGPC